MATKKATATTKAATAKAKSTKDAKKTQKEVKRGKVKEIDLDEDEFEEVEEEVLVDEDFDLEDEIEEEEDKEFEQLSIERKIEAIDKRTKIIFGLVIVTLVIGVITMIATFTTAGGTTTPTNNNNNSNEEESDYSYDTSLFKEISMSDIEAASKNKEIIVFIGRQGCYWCSLYAPIIGQSSQTNKYDVYYVDFGKIVDYELGQITDENGYNLLTNYVKNSKEFSTALDEGIGTPMTMFIKNNKLVNFISGYVDDENLSTYLKKEGFVK